MISYQDGTQIQVGDSVLIERGRTPGIIIQVIESFSDLTQWNLEEPGVMIKSQPFGLAFFPVSSFDDDPIVFIDRNKV